MTYHQNSSNQSDGPMVSTDPDLWYLRHDNWYFGILSSWYFVLPPKGTLQWLSGLKMSNRVVSSANCVNCVSGVSNVNTEDGINSVKQAVYKSHVSDLWSPNSASMQSALKWFWINKVCPLNCATHGFIKNWFSKQKKRNIVLEHEMPNFEEGQKMQIMNNFPKRIILHWG